ncbi:MAG: class I SAM-dependent methyltransferase [Clostridiales bacterium]|jgi:caffeoyl-CoA O-methyltransferase|nr:class I SAM-dependent methyltransferase [Clostridiales bacterium]
MLEKELLDEIRELAFRLSVPIINDESAAVLAACVADAAKRRFCGYYKSPPLAEYSADGKAAEYSADGGAAEYSADGRAAEYSDAPPCFRILEIGTGIGYSGLLMSEAAAAAARARAEGLTGPPQIFLTTLELDANSARLARGFFEKSRMAESIRLIEGDAAEFIVMTDCKFDFILLDGPKAQYEKFRPYLAELLNAGGVIFADNMRFKGYVGDAYIRRKHRSIVTALRAYTDNIKADGRFDTVEYAVGDGVIASTKKSLIK